MILYSKEAREKLFAGILKITKAVEVTLGPSGKNVLIKDSDSGDPFATKDGVTVASYVESEDEFEMMAIELVQSVAKRADALAGDGTTTATILARSIYEACLDKIDDLNMIDVNRGIQHALARVVENLKDQIVEPDAEILKKVAFISANHDQQIADIVYDAFAVAGNQGIVNIKESKLKESYTSSIKGMLLPIGYRSKAYINQPALATCKFKAPYVLMINKVISDVPENLGAFFSHCSDNRIPILLICKDMAPLVAEMLIENVKEGALEICVCRSPGFGQDQSELLTDIAIYLGATPFLEEDEIQFESLSSENFINAIPRASEVNVTEQTTSIKGPLTEDEEELKRINDLTSGRADQLRDKLDKEYIDSFEKSQLQSRISRLSEGICYIHIYARTPLEYKEKQGRIQDALYAIKGASEEGVLPGGGSALLKASYEIGIEGTSNDSFNFGQEILIKAIQKPFKIIMKNVNVNFDDQPNVNDYYTVKNLGFDAKSKHTVDMIEAGIMDPFKVTRTALESAADIAGMIMTTDCVIVKKGIYNLKNY